jgi:hypothetical protein
MLNNTVITAKQMAVVNDIDSYMRKNYSDYNSVEKLASRAQLTVAHGAVRSNSKGEPRSCSPFFITRNLKCQVPNSHGLYTLAVFKLKAEKKAKAKKTVAVATPTK